MSCHSEPYSETDLEAENLEVKLDGYSCESVGKPTGIENDVKTEIEKNHMNESPKNIDTYMAHRMQYLGGMSGGTFLMCVFLKMQILEYIINQR